jgi:hypothetical protein
VFRPCPALVFVRVNKNGGVVNDGVHAERRSFREDWS